MHDLVCAVTSKHFIFSSWLLFIVQNNNDVNIKSIVWSSMFQSLSHGSYSGHFTLFLKTMKKNFLFLHNANVAKCIVFVRNDKEAQNTS